MADLGTPWNMRPQALLQEGQLNMQKAIWLMTPNDLNTSK